MVSPGKSVYVLLLLKKTDFIYVILAMYAYCEEEVVYGYYPSVPIDRYLAGAQSRLSGMYIYLEREDCLRT